MSVLKLTPEVHDGIIEAIADGAPEAAAAHAVLISDRCLTEWKQIGKRDLEEGNDTIYSRLVLDIKKVRQKLMRELLNNIKAAGKNKEQWTANGWMLERIWRRHFGKEADLYEEVKKEQDEIKSLLKQLLEKKEISNG